MFLKFQTETPIVRGYNRSCIYDLPRNDYNFIPNEIVDKIYPFENFNFSMIQCQLDNNENLWLNYLIEKEYCFNIPKIFIDCFPKIDFKWESPSIITNAIIDIDILEHEDIVTFHFFENLNCKHLVVRILNVYEFDNLFSLLKKKIGELTFQSVEILIEKRKDLKRETFLQFKKKISKENEQIVDIKLFKKQKNKKNDIFRPNFVIDINMFSESLEHNVYYNRKLYVNSFGDIKNGLETNFVFSNITNSNDTGEFEQILLNSGIEKLWKVNKDIIDVCKDCEFRYMCIDNRIPIEREDKTFYFDKECSYNPYISKWQGDTGYNSLEEIGVFSNEKCFFIDTEKIQNINNIIWEDA